MLSRTSSGSFNRTRKYLTSRMRGDEFRDLERFGQMGVDALSTMTPRDTSETANSWTYAISMKNGVTTISWDNTNVNDGVKIAILLQYGHGTGTGGYVAGYDYINPAIRPIFDQIATNVWEKVTRG